MSNSLGLQFNETFLFIVTAGVGLLISFRFYKRKSTIDDHVRGSGQLGLLPIILSVFATSVSCISMSFVTEFYQNGITFVLETVAIAIASLAIIVQATVLLPFKFASVNEYFLLRFDSRVKYLLSGVYLITQVTVATITCYTTSIEFKNILQANDLTSFFITYFFCFLLAALGGFEGVVWTDAFQALVLVASSLTVAVVGAVSVGGIGKVFLAANEGDRLTFDFSLDPTKRLTVWSAVLSQVTNWTALSSLFAPALYQRYACLDKIQVKKGAVIAGLIAITFKLITCFVGLTMYAFYKGCDPVASGQLNGYDQMLPFFISGLGNKWGLFRGIYSIGYMSAGVSTMTAIINTTGVVTYKDLLERWINPTGKVWTGKMAIILIEFAMMLLCTVLFLLMEGGGNVTSLIPLYSSPCAILASSFILGIFVPQVNSKGLLVGSVVSLPVALIWSWSTNLATIQGLIKHPTKPLTVNSCPFNVTMLTAATDTVQACVFPLLRVSVFNQPILMFGLHFFLAITASHFYKSSSDKINENLVHAWCRRFIPRQYDLVPRIEKNEVYSSENYVNFSHR